MLKQFVLLTIVVGLILPLPANAILLGNHQLSFDLLGTTDYFEFADFREYEFPVQGLDWGGFSLPDLLDTPDPDLLLTDPLQNRNHIKMSFVGNLDVGMRLKTAISPDWSIEGYFRYTPVDLVIEFNGTDISEAQFTRYSGVTNPNDPEDQLNWVLGDYPTYHVIRFGANLDYTVYRSPGNTLNAYVTGGLGVISFFREGHLMVAADYDEINQENPAAPVNLDYYIPHDSFATANVGVGGVFFIHRYFGLNLDLRMNYTPFNIEDRSGFGSTNAMFFSASLGYAIRFQL